MDQVSSKSECRFQRYPWSGHTDDTHTPYTEVFHPKSKVVREWLIGVGSMMLWVLPRHCLASVYSAVAMVFWMLHWNMHVMVSVEFGSSKVFCLGCFQKAGFWIVEIFGCFVADLNLWAISWNHHTTAKLWFWKLKMYKNQFKTILKVLFFHSDIIFYKILSVIDKGAQIHFIIDLTKP